MYLTKSLSNCPFPKFGWEKCAAQVSLHLCMQNAFLKCAKCICRNCKMCSIKSLSNLPLARQNVLRRIRCIPACKMHFSNVQNVFVQIAKCNSPNHFLIVLFQSLAKRNVLRRFRCIPACNKKVKESLLRLISLPF